MMFFITMHIPSWFFGAMLPDPTERGLVMTIMELAAIPLWTLGIAGAITGALALVLCAFADDSLFMPDLSRRKILIWGLVLVTGSAPCLLLASAVSL
jgi:hypothetical protein